MQVRGIHGCELGGISGLGAGNDDEHVGTCDPGRDSSLALTNETDDATVPQVRREQPPQVQPER